MHNTAKNFIPWEVKRPDCLAKIARGVMKYVLQLEPLNISAFAFYETRMCYIMYSNKLYLMGLIPHYVAQAYKPTSCLKIH